MIDFKPWPKTPRFFRDVTITEKIDGTNAAIQIVPVNSLEEGIPGDLAYTIDLNGNEHVIAAQSRKRLITPSSDNAGFARWVWNNAESLVDDLGPGIHFGEWWGQGIQRRYGLDHKRFSLFNTHKWADREFLTPNLGAVPVLYQGQLQENAIHVVADSLRQLGSVAAPGFMDPEGIVIYHSAANEVFKVLLENDDIPKSVVAQPVKRRRFLSFLGL